MRKRNTAEVTLGHRLSVFLCLILLVFALIILMIMFRFLSGKSFSDSRLYPGLISFAAIIVFTLPLFILTLVRYRHYKNVDLKYLQKVKLEKTDSYSPLRISYMSSWHRIGFVVDVNVDGETRTVTTGRYFEARSDYLAPPCRLDDYIGKEAEIGYDAKQDEWIVICIDQFI